IGTEHAGAGGGPVDVVNAHLSGVRIGPRDARLLGNGGTENLGGSIHCIDIQRPDTFPTTVVWNVDTVVGWIGRAAAMTAIAIAAVVAKLLAGAIEGDPGAIHFGIAVR